MIFTGFDTIDFTDRNKRDQHTAAHSRTDDHWLWLPAPPIMMARYRWSAPPEVHVRYYKLLVYHFTAFAAERRRRNYH